MNKSLLPGIALAFAITLPGFPTSAAEDMVHHIAMYGTQDTPAHTLATGTSQGNGTETAPVTAPVAHGLQNTLFILSFGLIGIFLLRKSNNY